MFGRFRSPARDKNTDIDRLAAPRAAIQTARLRAESEASVLKKRLEATRMSLCLAIGNEDGSYYQREGRDENEIAALEMQMTTAERRLRDLEGQLAKFAEIDRLLDEMAGPKASD